MPRRERSTHGALVRTYVRTSRTPSGETVYHIRVFSSVGKFDRRGSGKTLTLALENARRSGK